MKENDSKEKVLVLKWFISAIIISNIIGFAGMYTFVYFLDFSSKTRESSNSSSSCGPGDASCESNVRNHINGISGMELNFISYIQSNDGSQSGKFRVGILKQDERGINQFSATITTDCNCNVIDEGGITSH